MAEPDAAKYDQKDATIHGFAPESQGSAIVSGEHVHDNTVIGTQINQTLIVDIHADSYRKRSATERSDSRHSPQTNAA